MIIAAAALRTTLVSLALLLVTFAGGLLAGAAVERTVRTPGETRLTRGESGPTAREIRSPRLLDQLELTEGQQEEIARILERGRAETKAFWENEGARLREIVDETRADIQAVLTPEQVERYEEMRARRGGRRGDGDGRNDRDGRNGRDERDSRHDRDGRSDGHDPDRRGARGG